MTGTGGSVDGGGGLAEAQAAYWRPPHHPPRVERVLQAGVEQQYRQ